VINYGSYKLVEMRLVAKTHFFLFEKEKPQIQELKIQELVALNTLLN
jgi:uncharacterized C2H2 Zn-finger protein